MAVFLFPAKSITHLTARTHWDLLEGHQENLPRYALKKFWCGFIVPLYVTYGSWIRRNTATSLTPLFLVTFCPSSVLWYSFSTTGSCAFGIEEKLKKLIRTFMKMLYMYPCMGVIWTLSLPFHIPKAWKRHLFRPGPPRIRHYRKYSPGTLIKFSVGGTYWTYKRYDLWRAPLVPSFLGLTPHP